MISLSANNTPLHCLCPTHYVVTDVIIIIIFIIITSSSSNNSIVADNQLSRCLANKIKGEERVGYKVGEDWTVDTKTDK